MHKILFRFFFIFFLLTISPWYLLYSIPGISYILDLFYEGEVRVVTLFNEYLLRVNDTLNQDGAGSGDTSFAWAQFYTYFILSVVGCAIWTALDRKRNTDYQTLDFWFCNVVRYYVALVSFSYGITKLFALQMPFPNLSQLATPLGDFLPMRLSWMFLGYSTPYQVFSGVMEVLVGILLMNRRTVTLGALLGIGVFSNVFILNLSYDIPVKLYSLQLVMYCIFMASKDWRRLLQFFWLNKYAEPTIVFDLALRSKWQRVARIVFKVGFCILFIVMPFHESWTMFKEESAIGEGKPIKIGLYNVKRFIRNSDSTAVSDNGAMEWKDIIFDKGGIGSVNSLDTLFRQRYRRGYFTFQPDTITETIFFKKYASDSTHFFEMKYKIVDELTIQLWGKFRSDSLRIELERSDRHFQLAEKQFHWISESNR